MPSHANKMKRKKNTSYDYLHVKQYRYQILHNTKLPTFLNEFVRLQKLLLILIFLF